MPVQLTAGQASTVQSLLTSGVLGVLQNLAVQYGLLLGSGVERGAEQIGFWRGVGGIVRAGRCRRVGAGRAISGAGVVSAGRDGECGGVQRGLRRSGPEARWCRQEWRRCRRSYAGLNFAAGKFSGDGEATSLWSGRLRIRIGMSHQHSFLRVGVSPSLETGIESTAQNQVFGQNAGSRAGVNQSRDVSGTFQHDTILNDTTFNQFRFQFARRGLHFGFSGTAGRWQRYRREHFPGYAYFEARAVFDGGIGSSGDFRRRTM